MQCKICTHAKNGKFFRYSTQYANGALRSAPCARHRTLCTRQIRLCTDCRWFERNQFGKSKRILPRILLACILFINQLAFSARRHTHTPIGRKMNSIKFCAQPFECNYIMCVNAVVCSRWCCFRCQFTIASVSNCFCGRSMSGSARCLIV